MKIADILENKSIDDAIKLLTTEATEREIETWQKEYDGTHKILDKPKKVYYTQDESGNDVTTAVDVSKIVIPYQEEIVDVAVGFLFGAPVELILNNKEDKYNNAFNLLKRVLKDNKADYFNIELTERLFIETKVAELWYAYKNAEEETKYRVMMLSKKNGDDIYAHFDDNNDMDAFIRKYKTTDLENKSYEHVDIYMADKTLKCKKESSDWEKVEETNPYGKIPVIYYEIEKPIWSKVQPAIDREEDLISKHGDTNDYFGTPILKVRGKIEKNKMMKKGQSGKVLQLAERMNTDGKAVYGDAEFLTWDNIPESIKLEYEKLRQIIYSKTQTPDLSFDNVKGLGSLRGITVKLMFLGSIMKAMFRQKIFGAGLTRRINLLTKMLKNTKVRDAEGYGSNFSELDISVNFQSVLPDHIVETIEALYKSRGGDAIIDKETAVKRHPFVDNPEISIENLKKEEKESKDNLGGSYDM